MEHLKISRRIQTLLTALRYLRGKTLEADKNLNDPQLLKATLRFKKSFGILKFMAEDRGRVLHHKTRWKLFMLTMRLQTLEELAQAVIDKKTEIFDPSGFSREFVQLTDLADEYLSAAVNYYATERSPTTGGHGSDAQAGPRFSTYEVSEYGLRSPKDIPSVDPEPDGDSIASQSPNLVVQKIPPSTVPVHFGTTRPKVSAETLPSRFGSGRGTSTLMLGVANVSIPKGHQIGVLERPLGIWKFRMREDKAKHIVLENVHVLSKEEWKISANSETAISKKKSAFLFIHGFNVTHQDAMFRAAQIARDIGYEGLVTAFSWGSEGVITGYFADESNVRLSIPGLVQFLELLTMEVGIEEFHVVAHSMGSRALLGALPHIPNWNNGQGKFSEVVFAAPDVDADEYRNGIAAVLKKARRYTLYCSERDRALTLSRTMRRNYLRAGDGGKNVLVAPGVETVDATSLGEYLLGLGHSYIGSKQSVLRDLLLVFMGQPMTREGLTTRNDHALGAYWEFKS